MGSDCRVIHFVFCCHEQNWERSQNWTCVRKLTHFQHMAGRGDADLTDLGWLMGMKSMAIAGSPAGLVVSGSSKTDPRQVAPSIAQLEARLR